MKILIGLMRNKKLTGFGVKLGRKRYQNILKSMILFKKIQR
jgi:hypothetical protein